MEFPVPPSAQAATSVPASLDLAERVLELPLTGMLTARGTVHFVDGFAVVRPEPGANVLGGILPCAIPANGADATLHLVLTVSHVDAMVTVTSPDGDVEYAYAGLRSRIGPQLLSLPLREPPAEVTLRFRNSPEGQPAELRVHQLRLDVSHKGPALRGWLRQHVRAGLPATVDADQPDAALALALCDWGYRHIPRAHHWCVLDHDPEFWPFTYEAGEALRLLLTQQAGVFCGGTANAMVEIYRLFGFDAYAVDCGWAEDYLTHVMNVVRLPGPGPMLTLCSYFNAALWQGDALADLPAALRSLGRDAKADCGFRTIDPASRKPFLVRSQNAPDLMELNLPTFEYRLQWERDGVRCYSSRYNIDNDETAPRLQPLLIDSFGEAGLHLLLLRVLGITKGPESETLTKTFAAARDTPDAIPAWKPRLHAPRATLLAQSLHEPC
jgi:hypothetical protein